MSEKEPHSEPPRVSWSHVAAVALVLTVLNTLKPAHEDDGIYLHYAAEFAAHPLSPYAFSTGLLDDIPASHQLVPPVLPYWLAGGVALFGTDTVLLKLWLFPFALVLASATATLAARAAPSLRVPLLWLAVLSPTVLPGFNVMLDVPVLALGAGALAVAVRATERESWTLALLSGILAGLAIQTKYTGLVPCAAVFLRCALQRQPGRGAAAVAVALTLAIGWELAIAHAQGESHFLIHLRQRQGNSIARAIHLALPLLTQVAGLAPAVVLLGLRALGWSARGTAVAGAVFVGGFAVLALVPSQAALLTRSSGKAVLTASNLVYGVMAVLAWLTCSCIAFRVLKRERAPQSADRALDLFLLGWLVLEVGGYFALSPFPAARRVIGPVFVLTLVAGRLAHVRGVPVRSAARVAGFGAALALLFFATDLLDACAARDAARLAARAAQPAPGGTYWHLMDWGTAGYHADREGLVPLRVNRRMPRPGDLVAVLDQPEVLASLRQHPEIVLEQIDTIRTGGSFPLRAAPGYYAGRTPLEHRQEERVRVLIFRVSAAPR